MLDTNQQDDREFAALVGIDWASSQVHQCAIADCGILDKVLDRLTEPFQATAALRPHVPGTSDSQELDLDVTRGSNRSTHGLLSGK
jgi:hypothetical protein